MSWFNQKIYTEEEVRSSSSGELPCNFQVGTNVWLHINDEMGTASVIDAIIAAVSIGANHEIKYDLYFQIGEQLYVRVNDFRGYISNVGEYLDKDGGLVSAEEIMMVLNNVGINKIQEPTHKTHLSIVKTNKD